jgi:hypothetical protein
MPDHFISIIPEVIFCNGRGADNLTLEKTLVTKSEGAIAGHFS